MLTYRGDKFVKGKKFKINEMTYRFSKRDEEKLIFESVSDKSKLTMTEEEFNEAERVLTEKINQENKEINELIGKILRSKGLARKYEDTLKSKGITVDYDNPQGVVLIGPNGKRLSASSKLVIGPSAPGQAKTHAKGISTISNYAKRYKKEYDTLKAMKRDDIIRKYNSLDSKEALKRHREDVKDALSNYEYYKNRADENNAEFRRKRREGHLLDPSSGGRWSHSEHFDKTIADNTVDYLNYLTKKDYGKDFRDHMSYILNGEDEEGYRNNYSTKNPVNNSRLDSIDTYENLKNDVKYAKNDVRDATYSKNGGWYSQSYGAMTDKQLERRIADMKKDLEKQIAELQKDHEKEVNDLRKDNVNRRKDREEKLAYLKDREKELDKFLKSKGVREAVLSIINGQILKESDNSIQEVYDSFEAACDNCDSYSVLYNLANKIKDKSIRDEVFDHLSTSENDGDEPTEAASMVVSDILQSII